MVTVLLIDVYCDAADVCFGAQHQQRCARVSAFAFRILALHFIDLFLLQCFAGYTMDGRGRTQGSLAVGVGVWGALLGFGSSCRAAGRCNKPLAAPEMLISGRQNARHPGSMYLQPT